MNRPIDEMTKSLGLTDAQIRAAFYHLIGGLCGFTDGQYPIELTKEKLVATVERAINHVK